MGPSDANKTKKDLLAELNTCRQRIKELEVSLAKQSCLDESIIGSEARYRSLVESTEDSIYLFDSEYNYMFMNKKHISRLGIKGNEYLGRPYTDFHKPEESQMFLEKLNEVFNKGMSLQFQHRSHRNGKYFLRTLSPIKGTDGKVAAVTVVSKDINKLKLAEFERDKIIFELQGALQQIKTLKGLIPICAWCKNIRNDQGYWQKIESYISEHSEADFTHGICEKCLKKVSKEEGNEE